MDPPEDWTFWPAFQHLFETPGGLLAPVCCRHPAVLVFCNRCALQMFLRLRSTCGAASSFAQLQGKRVLIKRKICPRSLAWCWLQLIFLLLLLEHSGRSAKGETFLCSVLRSLNTWYTLICWCKLEVSELRAGYRTRYGLMGQALSASSFFSPCGVPPISICEGNFLGVNNI